MKKFLIIFLLISSVIFPAFHYTHAADKVLVTVTEKIPGANCKCSADGATRTEDANGNTVNPGSGEEACGNINTRKYICEVDKWLTAFQNMIATIVRWVVNIILLLWVLAIVWAGIMMAWGSDSEEYTKKAKGWAINIVIGLIILFSFRYILGLLAPWIYQ